MKIEVQIEIRKNIYKNAIFRDFLKIPVKNILRQFEAFLDNLRHLRDF